MDFVDTEVKVEAIACQRVDGFIPSSHNKGGYEASGFILSLSSATCYAKNEKAKEALERMDNDAYQTVAEEFLKTISGVETVSALEDYLSQNEEAQEAFNEKLQEYQDDDAVKFSVRVMFHGFEDGEYVFTVDSQINWEMPYFRDGKGASVCNETHLAVKDAQELSSKLPEAIKVVQKLFKE